MQVLRRDVRAVRPDKGVKIGVHNELAEVFHFLQRLKNWPVERRSQVDLLWRRLRNLLGGYGDDLTEFTEAVFGEEALLAAWDEFHSWDPDAPLFDDDIDERSLFASWFFHIWSPEADEDPVDDPVLHERTPSSVYLERKSEKLDPLLRQYLDACTRMVPSFYTVVRCDPGRGFRLRDVITGAECEVIEVSATWPDEKIPALANLTPRQAVRTRDGREKVEALLSQYERDSGLNPIPVDTEVFQTLRLRLGLNKVDR